MLGRWKIEEPFKRGTGLRKSIGLAARASPRRQLPNTRRWRCTWAMIWLDFSTAWNDSFLVCAELCLICARSSPLCSFLCWRGGDAGHFLMWHELGVLEKLLSTGLWTRRNYHFLKIIIITIDSVLILTILTLLVTDPGFWTRSLDNEILNTTSPWPCGCLSTRWTSDAIASQRHYAVNTIV